MQEALRKVFAVAVIEFRFGFRRGGPVVALSVISLVIIGSFFFFADFNSRDLPEIYSPEIGARALEMTWPGFISLSLIVLPLISSSTIPVDRQYRVLELLTSYPINGWIYLTGKILGTWAVLLFVGLLALLLHFGLHLVLVGPMQLDLYLKLTLFAGIPVILWASALGIFTGAFLSSRRNAIVFGFLIGLLSVFPTTQAFRIIPNSFPFGMSVSSYRINMMTRLVTSDYVFQQYGLVSDFIPKVSPFQVFQMIVCGIFALLIMLSITRAWLLHKENF